MNSKGWSKFSRKNTDARGARVEKIPKPMSNPQASRDDKQSAIKIAWTAVGAYLNGGSDIESYHIEYISSPTEVTNFNGATWTELVGNPVDYNPTKAGKPEVYMQTGLSASQFVYYQIRCRNRWGWGPFSDPSYQVETARIPSQIPPVETSIEPEEGRLKISFEKARNNGSSIKSYAVELQDNDGKWKETDQCNFKNNFQYDPNLNRIYCQIDMNILWSKDQEITIDGKVATPTIFNLDFDKVIKVRVMATNGAGAGPWSNPNDDSNSAKVR